MACPVAERAPMSIWWHAQNSRPSSLLATSASVTAATARLCHSAYFLMARPTDGVLSSCRKKTEESPQLKNRHAEALNRSKQPFSQLSFMTFRKKKQKFKIFKRETSPSGHLWQPIRIAWEWASASDAQHQSARSCSCWARRCPGVASSYTLHKLEIDLKPALAALWSSEGFVLGPVVLGSATSWSCKCC